jgi:hypothetical protein
MDSRTLLSAKSLSHLSNPRRLWRRIVVKTSWSVDVSICRHVRNDPVHRQHLPVGVGALSGKLRFGTAGAGGVAAESPG